MWAFSLGDCCDPTLAFLLQVLDLHDNQLSALPDDIGQLTALQVWPQATGHLPLTASEKVPWRVLAGLWPGPPLVPAPAAPFPSGSSVMPWPWQSELRESRYHIFGMCFWDFIVSFYKGGSRK